MFIKTIFVFVIFSASAFGSCFGSASSRRLTGNEAYSEFLEGQDLRHYMAASLAENLLWTEVVTSGALNSSYSRVLRGNYEDGESRFVFTYETSRKFFSPIHRSVSIQMQLKNPYFQLKGFEIELKLLELMDYLAMPELRIPPISPVVPFSFASSNLSSPPEYKMTWNFNSNTKPSLHETLFLLRTLIAHIKTGLFQYPTLRNFGDYTRVIQTKYGALYIREQLLNYNFEIRGLSGFIENFVNSNKTKLKDPYEAAEHFFDALRSRFLELGHETSEVEVGTMILRVRKLRPLSIDEVMAEVSEVFSKNH